MTKDWLTKSMPTQPRSQGFSLAHLQGKSPGNEVDANIIYCYYYRENTSALLEN